MSNLLEIFKYTGTSKHTGSVSNEQKGQTHDRLVLETVEILVSKWNEMQ